jgi:hypothetical protein
VIRAVRDRVRLIADTLTQPPAAKEARRRDAAGLPSIDAGTERVLPEVMAWLCRAQDESISHDGGVARDYSLRRGWASSYPETTGYIIPTMLDFARRSGRTEFRERALRMVDWLVSIQFEEGGFQGGKVDSAPAVPVTFNTGQILIGLAAAEADTGRYGGPMRRAADWLTQTQDPDGCWRRNESPFAARGDKAYETHVAWGLFEAARLDPGRGYGEAGLANVQWALGSIASNGWIANCCLSDRDLPLTHTLGYALRGIVEANRFRPDPVTLEAAERVAMGLMGAMRSDGFLPGQLRADWSAAADWVCLTGTAQVALCWLLLFKATGDSGYLRAASTANAFVRRTVRLDGPPEQRGGVKGSFPIQGRYGAYEYLNWAAKFLADSLMLEVALSERRGDASGAATHRLRDSARDGA